ncbi:MAG: hypothetical protein V4545_06760 [Pseudomonadota bacterium]
MNIQTKLYPSAKGFVLIENFMVPIEFIEQLHYEVYSRCFATGVVSALEENCSEEYWASLSYCQRSVFGPCLLILIENGLERNFDINDYNLLSS